MSAAEPGTAMWAQALAVSVGGVAGCLARWGFALWLNQRWSGFPLGTLTVNLLGGLVIGACLAWFERRPDELLRLLVVTGFCGGFTTFSAFSVESLQLVQRGELALAALHTLVHVAGALLAAAASYRLLRTLIA